MAGSPSASVPSFKENMVHHMETVFGDIQKRLKSLFKNSLMVRLLPSDLRHRFIEKLKNLPKSKQSLALQIFQKEKSAFFRQAQANHSAQKKALQELKSIQAQAQKMKQNHLESNEMSHAENTLNRLSQ